jgi:hypothetical protein
MRNSLLCSVLAIGVLSCGSGQTKSTASAPPPNTQHAGGQMCPMMRMADANVVTSDTSDGVAIAFTTAGDVAELRAHVRKMAEIHNGMSGMHHGKDMHGGMGSGDMHGGMGSGDMHGGMGSGDMHGGMGMQMMRMVPSRASVEDVPGGARLVLVPTDPSQLTTLRAQAREHAAMMEKGECPMMETRPQPTDEHARHHPTGA